MRGGAEEAAEVRGFREAGRPHTGRCAGTDARPGRAPDQSEEGRGEMRAVPEGRGEMRAVTEGTPGATPAATGRTPGATPAVIGMHTEMTYEMSGASTGTIVIGTALALP